MKQKITKIRPGITARGWQTAIKDYTEPAVIEELAANSYDADATTVLVLLDSKKQELHVVDDGRGFSKKAIMLAGMLGGGDKQDIDTTGSARHYLGAYGFGLKATGNIASKIKIKTLSEDGEFQVELDWANLDEALKPDFDGYDLIESPKDKRKKSGTHIVLGLRKPTDDEVLDTYASALANLPEDNGKFKSYVGSYSKVYKELQVAFNDYGKLKALTNKLAKQKLLLVGDPSANYDIKNCQIHTGKDKQDSTVTYKIYFTGIRDGKVLPLKPGLRGIYVRIHGRLLKQNFTEQKYVYPISKWVKFASGLRVELNIDWLRGEISLSRDSLKFSNTKLEEQFRSTLKRIVSSFIQPELKKLGKKAEVKAAKEQSQRIELANKRIKSGKDVTVPSIKSGFNFVPETDSELALLIANETVMRKVNSAYKLVDYNDKAPYDCLLFDKGRREFIMAELEPTLMEFLQHKNIPQELTVVITWTLGKWRVGAKKKGIGYFFELIAKKDTKRGHYQLNAYIRASSKEPQREFTVLALDQILRS